jgi:hypothetical protein
MGLGQGAAALAAAAMVATLSATPVNAMPAPRAAGYGSIAAEKVRQLDIMLMVSSLRCRNTADNFQADYAAFSAAHLTELNQASQTLESDFARRFGSSGAQRALDKLSTSMANRYGQGHPWLDCHDLKLVTRELAGDRRTDALLSAADNLLQAQGNGRAYLDARY